MPVEHIRHFLYISENLCSSGQPEAEDFHAIAAAGFQVVINLAMPDSVNAIPEEEWLVVLQDMDYHHIPVPFDAPQRRHLEQFIQLMENLQGRKVWVHCALNYRASAFLYLYFRWLGRSETDCRVAVFPGWKADVIWHKFMTQNMDEF